MSYDYILGKGDASMDLETFMESASNGVIATQEILEATITKLFPAMRWERLARNSTDGGAQPALFDQMSSFGQVWWFGQAAQPGPPEFRFSPESDGTVRLLFMSRCERSEVELVAKTLNLAALDEQTMEVFGG